MQWGDVMNIQNQIKLGVDTTLLQSRGVARMGAHASPIFLSKYMNVDYKLPLSMHYLETASGSGMKQGIQTSISTFFQESQN